MSYRGRIAPSPTGYLHLGHARTFWTAQERARSAGGKIILRNEDLDPARSKAEFVQAMFEDLKWLGFEWHEGPDIGGPFAPFDSKSGTLPVSSAYAGVEFQPTSNLSLSLGVGVVQQSGRIDSEINSLPGASSFSVGGRRY